MKWINGRVALSALLVAVFAGGVAVATGYSPDARLAPLTVGIPGLLLSLAQLVVELRAAARHEPDDSAGDRAERRRALALFAWLSALIAGCIVFGILPAALLLVGAFLRRQQRESLRLSVTVAGSFTLLLYLAFDVALGMDLYEGLVYGWFAARG